MDSEENGLALCLVYDRPRSVQSSSRDVWYMLNVLSANVMSNNIIHVTCRGCLGAWREQMRETFDALADDAAAGWAPTAASKLAAITHWCAACTGGGLFGVCGGGGWGCTFSRAPQFYGGLPTENTHMLAQVTRVRARPTLPEPRASGYPKLRSYGDGLEQEALAHLLLHPRQRSRRINIE